MSPLDCPNTHFYPHFKCISCPIRYGNECRYYPNEPRKLSDILTIEERITLLEERPQVPEVNIVTIKKKDLDEWKKFLYLLAEKVTKLEGELFAQKKKRSRYK